MLADLHSASHRLGQQFDSNWQGLRPPMQPEFLLADVIFNGLALAATEAVLGAGQRLSGCASTNHPSRPRATPYPAFPR